MNIDDLVKSYEGGSVVYFEEEDYETIIDRYLDQDKVKEAVEAAKKGCMHYPFSSELKLRLADLHIVEERINEAMEIIHSLEHSYDARIDVALLKARALMHTGQRKEAHFWYEQAISQTEGKEDTFESLLVAAEDCVEYEDFKAAVSYFLRAKSIQPLETDMLNDLAYCYERIDDLNNSITCYEEYLDVLPFDDRVWYNVGTLYGMNANTEKALEAFDYALTLNPNQVSALYNQSILLYNMARYADAEDSLRRFLEAEPDDFSAICYLALCCLEQEKLEDAITTLRKALKLNPMDEWCLSKLKELTSK